MSETITVTRRTIDKETGIWFLSSQILKENKIENTGINQYHLLLWIKEHNKDSIQEEYIKENSVLKLPDTQDDINKICRTKLKMNQNREQSIDNDFCLKFKFNDIIYQTTRTKVNDENGNEAADLAVNDLDKELVITPDDDYKTYIQAAIEKKLNIKQGENKRKKNIVMPFESFKSKNPEQLFEAFRKGIKRYTKNGLNNEVNQLITKFSCNNNISSEFKNENIQKAACAHEKTKDIIQRITDGINKGIKFFKGDIDEFYIKLKEQEKDIKACNNDTSKIEAILSKASNYSLWEILHWSNHENHYIDYTPDFSSAEDQKAGLKIAINDVWAYDIKISNFRLYKNKFTYDLAVQFYDHFGLDTHDIKKFGAADDTFKIWYYLQHSKRFNGKYKPFITTWIYKKENIGGTL